MWQAISFSVRITLLLLSYAYHLHVAAGLGTVSVETRAAALVPMFPWLVIVGSLSLLVQTRREIFELGAYLDLFYETDALNHCYARMLEYKRNSEGGERESHTWIVILQYLALAVLTLLVPWYISSGQRWLLLPGSPAFVLHAVLSVKLFRIPASDNRPTYRDVWKSTLSRRDQGT